MIPGRKTSLVAKADFPCSLQENENEKWRMGVVTSICAKEYNSFREELFTFDVTFFKVSKIKKAFTVKKEEDVLLPASWFLNVLIYLLLDSIRKDRKGRRLTK